MIWVYVCVIAISYAIGSVSFSVIFSRKLAGFDVREKGSGNAGTTNVLRTVGKKAALITLICDVLKGVVAILLAIIAKKIYGEVNEELLKQIAGFSVILGHTFPIFFEFRGGKGVATALGVILTSNWKIGLICLSFALIIMVITKMVSVGSIASAILYPILTIFLINNNNIFSILFSALIALLIVFNHRTNIKRIKEGTENKINLKK